MMSPPPPTFSDGPARPARDVPIGASWAFTEHRSMDDVMRDEAAESLIAKTAEHA